MHTFPCAAHMEAGESGNEDDINTEDKGSMTFKC